ncbi:MAG: CtsR family transcriptional regulator [Clostridia bacterium]|nr:CtsR family transcriptional regulator [Clostridia bacterium]
MLISDMVAKMISELLEENDGTLEIGRNELASRAGCVPSQINYVITSRFTPERGYIVESRRGGGGYLKITRVKMDRNTYLMHFYNAIGDGLDANTARAFVVNLYDKEIISPREASLLNVLFSEGSLSSVPREMRDSVRADLFKNAILVLLKE